MPVHWVEGVGANLTCWKPLAALATIEPVAPVVRSRTSVRSPCSVSWSVTLSRSPEFMKRDLAGSGVNLATLVVTGVAGAVALPDVVKNAKLMYSSPVSAAQASFCSAPVTGFSDSESTLSAAHHLVGSQLVPPTAAAAGHWTQPGG